MREVFDGLGLVLEIPQPPRDMNLKNQMNNLVDAWKGATGVPSTAAVSDARPDLLRAENVDRLHRRMHGVFVRFEAQFVRRAARHEQLFIASDPRHHLMPEDLRVRRRKDFEELDDYMKGVLHHGATTREEFADRLAASEELLRDLVRPAPTEARRVIDEILGEGPNA